MHSQIKSPESNSNALFLGKSSQQISLKKESPNLSLVFRKIGEHDPQRISTKSLMIKHRASVDYSYQTPDLLNRGMRPRVDSLQSINKMQKSFTRDLADGMASTSSPLLKTKRVATKPSAFSFAQLKQPQTDGNTHRTNGAGIATTPKGDTSPDMFYSMGNVPKSPPKRLYMAGNRGSETNMGAGSKKSSNSSLLL